MIGCAEWQPCLSGRQLSGGEAAPGGLWPIPTISFMSETRKANVPESTYFVTLTVVDWIDVFSRQDYSDELIKNLHYCQKNKFPKVFAYVIMTSRVHLLCRRKEGLYLSFIINHTYSNKSFTLSKDSSDI